MSGRIKPNDFSELIALCGTQKKSKSRTIDLNVLLREHNVSKKELKDDSKKIKLDNDENKILKSKREWYERNKEIVKKKNAEYKREHKEEIKRQKHLYYLRKKGSI